MSATLCIDGRIMNSYSMSFDGSVLVRGFWLYIWRIQSPAKTFFYVGRNGDSSSIHAGSPFDRIGQHLNFRPNAKGNSLARALAKEGIEPSRCYFSMICVGPIFPEQDSKEKHVECRDITASLERDLAEHLKIQGLVVLGTHASKKPPQPALLAVVFERIGDFIRKP